VHNGAPIDLEQASPQVITAALHDQFWLVSALIGIALITSLLTWRWEIQHGLTGKARESTPAVESV
jgi:surface polysaccharide O-acyltransferase-like enzyme